MKVQIFEQSWQLKISQFKKKYIDTTQ